MKVVLVQPRYFNVWEALGLGYLGACAQKLPHPPELSFFQGRFDTDEIIVDAGSTADIVAFSCVSPVFKQAVELARRMKQRNPKVWTVFGGPHPSAVPEDCLREEGVDQVVVGEGERAFEELLGGRRDALINGERLATLDDLIPDRALIKNERTVDLCEQMTGLRIASFQSTRGCPFRCAFCGERAVSGVHHPVDNPVRERSPGHLLDEVETVAGHLRLDHFKFVDATWNTSPGSNERIKRFCEEKLRRGISLSWEANIHAAFATHELLALMKEAGCSMINVGCESGSDRILKTMRKGVTTAKIKEVFEWGRRLGLKRRAFFLIGMPEETDDDLVLTERLVDEIKPDVFGVTILCPYPGSDLHDPSHMRDYDWSVADEYSNPYWGTASHSNADLKRWQQRLTRKFGDILAWHHTAINEGGSCDPNA